MSQAFWTTPTASSPGRRRQIKSPRADTAKMDSNAVLFSSTLSVQFEFENGSRRSRGFASPTLFRSSLKYLNGTENQLGADEEEDEDDEERSGERKMAEEEEEGVFLNDFSPPSPVFVHTCEICNGQFPDEGNLSSHVLSLHKFEISNATSSCPPDAFRTTFETNGLHVKPLGRGRDLNRKLAMDHCAELYGKQSGSPDLSSNDDDMEFRTRFRTMRLSCTPEQEKRDGGGNVNLAFDSARPMDDEDELEREMLFSSHPQAPEETVLSISPALPLSSSSYPSYSPSLPPIPSVATLPASAEHRTNFSVAGERRKVENYTSACLAEFAHSFMGNSSSQTSSLFVGFAQKDVLGALPKLNEPRIFSKVSPPASSVPPLLPSLSSSSSSSISSSPSFSSPFSSTSSVGASPSSSISKLTTGNLFPLTVGTTVKPAASRSLLSSSFSEKTRELNGKSNAHSLNVEPVPLGSSSGSEIGYFGTGFVGPDVESGLGTGFGGEMIPGLQIPEAKISSSWSVGDRNGFELSPLLLASKGMKWRKNGSPSSEEGRLLQAFAVGFPSKGLDMIGADDEDSPIDSPLKQGEKGEGREGGGCSVKKKPNSIFKGVGRSAGCTECGRTFHSWKALFGHMRCHPEREWRGIIKPTHLHPSTSSNPSSPAPSPTAVRRAGSLSKKKLFGAKKVGRPPHRSREAMGKAERSIKEEGVEEEEGGSEGGEGEVRIGCKWGGRGDENISISIPYNKTLNAGFMPSEGIKTPSSAPSSLSLPSSFSPFSLSLSPASLAAKKGTEREVRESRADFIFASLSRSLSRSLDGIQEEATGIGKKEFLALETEGSYERERENRPPKRRGWPKGKKRKVTTVEIDQDGGGEGEREAEGGEGKVDEGEGAGEEEGVRGDEKAGSEGEEIESTNGPDSGSVEGEKRGAPGGVLNCPCAVGGREKVGEGSAGGRSGELGEGSEAGGETVEESGGHFKGEGYGGKDLKYKENGAEFSQDINDLAVVPPALPSTLPPWKKRKRTSRYSCTVNNLPLSLSQNSSPSSSSLEKGEV